MRNDDSITRDVLDRNISPERKGLLLATDGKGQ